MREIKFRGKSLALDVKGEHFVYGSLVIQDGIPFIYEDKKDKGSINYHQVIPSTIGQFTGLHDKNGVEIYEGDVVKVVNNYNEATKKTSDNVIVKFKNGSFIVAWDVDGDEHYNHFTSYNIPIVTFEIIGNIHEVEE